MLKFTDRKEFCKKLADLDSLKAEYYVDMVKMHIWGVVIPSSRYIAAADSTGQNKMRRE